MECTTRGAAGVSEENQQIFRHDNGPLGSLIKGPLLLSQHCATIYIFGGAWRCFPRRS
jgi:hypothetical protein